MSLVLTEIVRRLRRDTTIDPMSSTMAPGDWSTATSATIAGCNLAPGTNEEFPGVDIEQLQWLATLYMPLGADVQPGDRIAARGHVWDVTGTRNDWFGLQATGSSITLKQVREVT